MKSIAVWIIGILLFSAQSYGQGRIQQVKDGELIWNPIQTRQFPENPAIDFTSCQSCYSQSNNPRFYLLPVFVSGIKAQKAKFLKASWKKIPHWELPGFDTLAYLHRPAFAFQESEQLRQLGTEVLVNPVRKRGVAWERLVQYVLEVEGALYERQISPFRTATEGSSVFANGPWLKMGIVQSGVYQLTANELAARGLQLDGRPSFQIKMYGSGGKMLSEANRDYNFQDISQIAIQVEDGGDGIFNAGDRILFYGQGPDSWNFHATSNTYQFRKNIYSDTSYYFLTISEGPGQRIVIQEQATNPDLFQTRYQDQWIYGQDRINVLSAGREWYSDVLDFTPSKELNFDVRGISADSVARFRFGLMSRSSTPYPFRLRANGASLLPDQVFSAVNISAPFSRFGSDLILSRTWQPSPNTNSLNINILYDKQGNFQSQGYINFVEMNAWRSLEWRGQNFNLRSSYRNGETIMYMLGNMPSGGIRVWNVSRPDRPTLMRLSGNSFAVKQDTLHEFFVFNENALPVPLVFKRVFNQDLRGMEVPDLLIVTHPRFYNQANKLANFRRDYDKMDVEVVTTEQVYNEFSSGSQDITAIRNLAMHLYYKGNPDKFKFLLLFGDCSFDYKDRVANNTNFVPTYQSPEWLGILDTYASDDYFGILSRFKGEWGSNDLLDIGVGRLPAKNEEEAATMVNKLIHYASNPRSLGNWRNQFAFVADDGDNCLHSNQSNSLAEQAMASNPNIHSRKIFLGAYPQVANPGGFTSPAATNELLNSIEKGSLIVNYTGHGGETVWADEFLFTTDMISRLRNIDRLSFFITATCDFGRHDYPSQTSGAEALMLNPNGGAIGIMTTGRPVNAFSNFSINSAFFSALFQNSNGRVGRFGDIMRLSKNISSDKRSNRGFTLLGDPSARLAFPEQEVVLTNFTDSDTIKGLQVVNLEGEIQKEQEFNPSFNGRVFAQLFDRPTPFILQDNEPGISRCPYTYQKNVLFNGSAPVRNGKFSIQFKVSRDISFQVGDGKLLLYAMDPTQVKDARGNKRNVKVGGLVPNPKPDDEGPIVKLAMNDWSFVNGGLVGLNADLLAFFEDSSGIDVTGLGLGHDLIAVLDNKEVFVLNEFFEAENGNFKKGSLRFPFRNLSPGQHQIRLRVWDNNNNSSEAEITFFVGVLAVNGIAVRNVGLFPNPFSDKLYITMENSLAGENITISLQVIDLLGREVAEKVWSYANSIAQPGVFKELAWDGNKADGTKLPPGPYFCNIAVKSDIHGEAYKIHQKVILVR